MKRCLTFAFGSIIAVCLVCYLMPILHVGALGCSNEPSYKVNGRAYHWDGGTPSSPHVINIYLDPGLTSAEGLEAAQAIQSWFQSSVMVNNNITANFVTSDPGPVSNAIRFKLDSTAYPDDFMRTEAPANDSGSIIGSTTYINRGAMFATASGGTALDYDPTLPSAANFFTGSVGHEVGHALGLADRQEPPCGATSTSIMGDACGTNNQGDGSSPPNPASITPTSCDRGTVNINIVSPGSNGGPDPNEPTSLPPAPGPSGSYVCSSFDDWDETTATLIDYSYCWYM